MILFLKYCLSYIYKYFYAYYNYHALNIHDMLSYFYLISQKMLKWKFKYFN